jgi:Protein of unknown function (DUF1579)
MTKGFGRTVALLGAACALVAIPAVAQKEKKPAPGTGGRSQTAREEGAPAKTSADGLPRNVVEEMTRYTAPGSQHKELAKFAGKWTARTRVWENPDAKPVEFPGEAEYKMILGGRFLELESRATLNDKESHGLGIFGYDAFKEKYSYYYIHDGETQALVGLGDRDSTGAAITFSIAMDMPLAGEHAKPIRAVLRRVSSDRHIFEMYERYLDDREWKVLEIIYDRAR